MRDLAMMMLLGFGAGPLIGVCIAVVLYLCGVRIS